MLLGLLPHLGVFAFVAMFPRLLGSLIGGRDVTWSSAAYGWFALVLLVLLMLAASLAIAEANHHAEATAAGLNGNRLRCAFAALNPSNGLPFHRNAGIP